MNSMQEYQNWLALTAGNAQEQQELRALENDLGELEDRFYRELSFGTAGMRGVLGLGPNRMNRYTVGRVTLALAALVKEHEGGAERGVAIGYDSRNFSKEFARETALILASQGVKAFLFDSLRPVPVLSFTVRHLHCLAGVVITASHNPSKYNGYKVYWEDGGQLPPDRAAIITGRLSDIGYGDARPMDEKEARAKGLLITIPPEVDDAYIAAVEKLAVNPELTREMGKTLKIVYTPLHGSGNIPVRRVLKEIGVENVFVVPEQELPNGNFPTVRVPNPEEKDAFDLAVAMQKKLGADLCVGTDPDCDRVGVACLTASGDVRLLTGNQIGCILLHYILSQKKALGTLPKNAAAVKSIVSTEMARAICLKYDTELFDVLTGFKFIAEKIQQFEETGSNTFEFGFEESYGFLSGTDVRDKDGVNAVMLIAEAACYYKKKNMTLVDAIEELYEEFGVFGERTVSVVLPGKDGLEKMQAIMKALRDEGVEKVGPSRVMSTRDYMMSEPKSDVLYYTLEQGWACVRPSGTEPKIKIYAGAVTDSHEETNRLLDAYIASLRERMGVK
ncbi:MAG TPA: phospho-sugar mutase [Candidatus Pullichristensenella stercoripullorum]|nr:phospho-sugar mutase [Candidatus Pullichristensenella stercoripullorum]